MFRAIVKAATEQSEGVGYLIAFSMAQEHAFAGVQSLFCGLRRIDFPPPVFYNKGMSDISKFNADIQRIKKHVRADNGGNYDGQKVCSEISKLFINSNRNVTDLARSLADYWFNTYVLSSQDIKNEPSEENLNRIFAFQNFLDGDEDSDYSCLTSDDWETLKDFANDEAENMDLDQLQNMMSLILHNGAL